jgi:hypothetical protein
MLAVGMPSWNRGEIVSASDVTEMRRWDLRPQTKRAKTFYVMQQASNLKQIR